MESISHQTSLTFVEDPKADGSLLGDAHAALGSAGSSDSSEESLTQPGARGFLRPRLIVMRVAATLATAAAASTGVVLLQSGTGGSDAALDPPKLPTLSDGQMRGSGKEDWMQMWRFGADAPERGKELGRDLMGRLSASAAASLPPSDLNDYLLNVLSKVPIDQSLDEAEAIARRMNSDQWRAFFQVSRHMFKTVKFESVPQNYWRMFSTMKFTRTHMRAAPERDTSKSYPTPEVTMPAPERDTSKSYPVPEEAAALPPGKLVTYLTFEITQASFKEFSRHVDEIAFKMTSEQWNAFVRYVLNDLSASDRKEFKPLFQIMLNKVSAHKKDFVTPKVAASFPPHTLYLYVRDVVTQGAKEDFGERLKRLGTEMTSDQLNAFACFVSHDLSPDHKKEFIPVFRGISNAYRKNLGHPMCHEKKCYLGRCIPLNIATTHKLGSCCTASHDQCSLIESGRFIHEQIDECQTQ